VSDSAAGQRRVLPYWPLKPARQECPHLTDHLFEGIKGMRTISSFRAPTPSGTTRWRDPRTTHHAPRLPSRVICATATLSGCAKGRRRLAGCLAVLALGGVASLACRPAAAAELRKEPPWPRLEMINGNSKVFYNLQVDSWEGEVLAAHCTVAFQAYHQPQPDVGRVQFRARTAINQTNRLVRLRDFEIVTVAFPSAPDRLQEYSDQLQAALPRRLEVIALDRLAAAPADAKPFTGTKPPPRQNPTP